MNPYSPISFGESACQNHNFEKNDMVDLTISWHSLYLKLNVNRYSSYQVILDAVLFFFFVLFFAMS